MSQYAQYMAGDQKMALAFLEVNVNVKETLLKMFFQCFMKNTIMLI